MKKAALIALVLLFGFPLHAQGPTYDYGKPETLKGLTRVYIDAGPDLKTRNRIEEDLKKAKLGLEFVEMDNTQILITFRMTVDHRSVVVTDNVITEPDYPHGRAMVLVVDQQHDKPRLVMSFDDIQRTILEGNPLKNFIKEFIKVYKKANDIK